MQRLPSPASSVKFYPQDASSKASAIEASQFSTSALRDIAPYTGAYMNEASGCPAVKVLFSARPRLLTLVES